MSIIFLLGTFLLAGLILRADIRAFKSLGSIRLTMYLLILAPRGAPAL